MLHIQPRSCQETEDLSVLLRQTDHALNLLVVHTDDLAEVLDDCGRRQDESPSQSDVL